MRVNELPASCNAEIDNTVLRARTRRKLASEALITLAVGVVFTVVSAAGLGFFADCLLDPTCRPFAGSFDPTGLAAMLFVGCVLLTVGLLLHRGNRPSEDIPDLPSTR